MRIRKLEQKDAPLMLEWMHDESVVHDLKADFASKTITDCENFIEAAQTEEIDVHRAIVSDADEYMGTVSLKYVDRQAKTAEFAITVRKSAMGNGYSMYGMQEILRFGINELHLENIYWCVSNANKRAIRFYDKNNYVRTTDVAEQILSHYSVEERRKFIWYIYSK